MVSRGTANCDVLVHPMLLHDLVVARHESVLLLAYRVPRSAGFGDEEMKVNVPYGRVVEMAKAMEPAEADGETLGIVHLEPLTARKLRDTSNIDSSGRRPGRLWNSLGR